MFIDEPYSEEGAQVWSELFVKNVLFIFALLPLDPEKKTKAYHIIFQGYFYWKFNFLMSHRP